MRIVISPTFIQDTTKKNNNTTITEFDEKLKFWQYVSTIKNTNEFLFPNNNINECAIRNDNSWAIDAKGFAYKCWEIIGNEFNNKKFSMCTYKEDNLEKLILERIKKEYL